MSFTDCLYKTWNFCWALVAHACNLSCSGERSGASQFKASPGKQFSTVLETPSQKSSSQKRAGGVAQGVGPEFKPQYCKKKKKT
jgi:hypothetical protein